MTDRMSGLAVAVWGAALDEYGIDNYNQMGGGLIARIAASVLEELAQREAFIMKFADSEQEKINCAVRIGEYVLSAIEIRKTHAADVG